MHSIEFIHANVLSSLHAYPQNLLLDFITLAQGVIHQMAKHLLLILDIRIVYCPFFD